MHPARERIEKSPAEKGSSHNPGSVVIDLLAQSWLDAQCSIVTGLSSGVVFRTTGRQANELVPVAVWPKSVNLHARLALIANRALEESSFAIETPDQTGGELASYIVAVPLVLEESETSIAVLELSSSLQASHQALLQLLQWGANWYKLLRKERRIAQPESQLAAVVQLLARSLEHPEFDASTIMAVTELATQLSCSRVSLGIMRGKHIVVSAVSNSSAVDIRANLTRDIAAAMEEAIDQGALVAFPPRPGTLPYVSFAQEALARRAEAGSVVSLPLTSGGKVVAAITLEHEGKQGLDQTGFEICEMFGSLLGPIIELKHERDRWIGQKVFHALGNFVRRIFGPGHIALKVCAAAIAVVALTLGLVSGDYRITAKAKVEGSVKRVITAPQDGYVSDALLRAGDQVEPGQLIASLDDRELKLERVKWRSQVEQINKELRAAAVTRDRSKTAILRAQQHQMEAQLALVTARLDRTQLTSPFAGIVVSGDLSQNLGSPVKRGQVLFEVAPLESFRVFLEVDERDIGEISVHQLGELTLTALPNVSLPIKVNRIVPVATAEESGNHFRVEATIDQDAYLIRPGMEGIGKIKVDERKLIWIWTHALTDWFRLTIWTWFG